MKNKKPEIEKVIEWFQGDTDFESGITCPYCGMVQSDAGAYDYDEGVTECELCENEFRWHRDVEVTYGTEQKSENL